MDPSTAAHRLRTDLLWGFVQTTGGLCCRCGEPMTRETFSIDHLEPWLDSSDPMGLFFSPDNIGYSHMACNYGEARRPNKLDPEVRKQRRNAHYRTKWRERNAAAGIPRVRRSKYD